MKSKKGLIIIIVAVLVLAAGGFGVYKFLIQKSTVQASASGGTQEMTIDSQLAVGILKLENTDLAVTAEQAQALLPLWKGVLSFGTSDTISDAEMDALYAQIEETLTADQMAEINSMDLENVDMATLASDLGVSMGMGGQNGANPNVSSDQQATMMAQNPDDMPQGDFSGQMPSDNSSGTTTGRGGNSSGGGRDFAGGSAPSGGGGMAMAGGGGGAPSGGSDMAAIAGGMTGDTTGGDAAMFMGQGTQTTDSSGQTTTTTRSQSPFLNLLINLLTERAAEQ